MGMDNPYNIFESAQKQFDRIADLISLEPAMREFLRQPRREYPIQPAGLPG